MRNPAFCICENKGADTQRLCFRFIYRYIHIYHTSLTRKCKPLAVFCGRTARRPYSPVSVVPSGRKSRRQVFSRPGLHDYLVFLNDTEKMHVAFKACGAGRSMHYANTPMQYTAIFHGCKNVNFQMKKYNIFLFLRKTLIVGTH